jgi:exodeoxyribonuclease VII small subunit
MTKSKTTAALSEPQQAGAQESPPSYEIAVQELDALVQRMESSQLPLDQLLQAYQRGAYLLGFCRDKLQNIEDQIKVLDEGQLKPWQGAL